MTGGPVLYFAYGSNLDWEQMKLRCPSARFAGRSLLPDHRLAFTRRSEKRRCGVADIVESRRDEVWGVTYEVSEADMKRLDAFEGFLPEQGRIAYRRLELVVLTEGQRGRGTRVVTYEVAEKQAHTDPSAEYLGHIVRGAMHWRLPRDYVGMLRGFVT